MDVGAVFYVHVERMLSIEVGILVKHSRSAAYFKVKRSRQLLLLLLAVAAVVGCGCGSDGGHCLDHWKTICTL